jgi:NTP pyrophosphatase (non-canonical NTP hydrolase)
MELGALTAAMHEFVQSKGWYEGDSPRPQSQKNLAISLSLEASEVLQLFQWQDQVQSADQLADELADVMLYTLQLASVSGVELEAAVLAKLRRNATRTWERDEDPRP